MRAQKYSARARVILATAEDCGILVPEQHLDHANVDLLLEQMRGKAMPQRVQRHGLVELSQLRRGTAGAVELARRQRVDPVLPGNSQPWGRAAFHQARSRSRRCSESMT